MRFKAFIIPCNNVPLQVGLFVDITAHSSRYTLVIIRYYQTLTKWLRNCPC